MKIPHSLRGVLATTLGLACASAFASGGTGHPKGAISVDGDSWLVLGPPASTLTITSTLAPGSISQVPSQTLTFTFSEDVTGFDASDVVVVGAEQGTFTPESATVYTLDVTGTGGTVTASIDAGAAATVASGSPTEAASFSDFYQDTWTLILPGRVAMDLIRIPAGTFTMGSPPTELMRASDEIEHEVTLTQDFYLGKTEVTQQQWLAVRGSWPGAAPNSTAGLGDNTPAYNVSHDDVQTFMSDLDAVIAEPGSFGLPTESQWEYACRAGTATRFSFGDGFGDDESCSAEAERTDNLWYCGNNSPNGAKEVGLKPANPWGLQDMHGNIFEWCADWYGDYPEAVSDPTGPETATVRVVRGGGWIDLIRFSRSARRWEASPTSRYYFLGFRVLAVR